MPQSQVRSLIRGLSLLAIMSGVAFASGCSRPVGSVSGKVTYKDKSLKGGNVTFVSTDGGQSYSGVITEEGTYKVLNITGGSYKVCVETASLKPTRKGGGPRPQPKGSPKEQSITVPEGMKMPEGYHPSSPADASLAAAAERSAKFYVEIPPNYADAAKTDLTRKVVGGEQTYDIELK